MLPFGFLSNSLASFSQYAVLLTLLKPRLLLMMTSYMIYIPFTIPNRNLPRIVIRYMLHLCLLALHIHSGSKRAPNSGKERKEEQDTAFG